MKQLDGYSMMIVCKYLKQFRDVRNLGLVSKKNSELPLKFHFNPISVTQKSRKFFPKMQTQYLYTANDEIIENMDKYIITYPIDVKYVLNPTLLKTEKKITTDNIKYVNVCLTQTIPTHQLMELKISKFAVDVPKDLTDYSPLNYATRLCPSFFAYNSLTSFKFPNTMRKFGKELFSGCSQLVEVDYAYSSGTIKERTFSGCHALRRVKLSPFNSLRELTLIDIKVVNVSVNGNEIYGRVPYRIFKTMKNVVCNEVFFGKEDYMKGEKQIPDGVVSIECGCFNCLYDLKEMNIPDSVTEIGDCAFHRCAALTRVKVSKNLKKIGWMAFGFCEKLTNIEFPPSVNTIPTRCFVECSSLETVKGQNLTNIETEAFLDCKAKVVKA
uniref:Leucine rich repeat containing protein BspA family protein n=1 Tax=Entamoeba invadens TaxID=33085 RepID=S0B757_ENTIV|nr:hypothetical protein, conserved [Entamoeba invadens]